MRNLEGQTREQAEQELRDGEILVEAAIAGFMPSYKWSVFNNAEFLSFCDEDLMPKDQRLNYRREQRKLKRKKHAAFR